jgi:AcrR family transcriptional regulator
VAGDVEAADGGGSDHAVVAMPRTQRERRHRIVLTALEMLDEAEYDRIQMRQVADRAGVALGTLYRYFSSKEHLYAAVLVEWSSGFPRVLERHTAGMSSEDRLRDLLRRGIRSFERHPQIFRLEIVLEKSDEPAVRELFVQWSQRSAQAFRDAVAALPRNVAEEVVIVAGEVLNGRLRAWAMGRCSIDEVYTSVLGSVDLIFSPAPQDSASPLDVR